MAHVERGDRCQTRICEQYGHYIEFSIADATLFFEDAGQARRCAQALMEAADELDSREGVAARLTGERTMTTDEAIARLKEQQRDRDIENAHAEADHVLCDFLDSMGYSDVVAAYSAVPKWYA